MKPPADTHLRFTIVTPNRNGQAYLRPCLESVIDQDYPNLEYIVVDGESSDGSRILIEEYRAQLARIICEADSGHADALNKGFAASSGEIMGWINSDDTILPGTLNFVNRLFQARPDIAWITGRPSSMNADGQVEWIGPARPWSRLRYLSGDNQWIQQESTFWRRSLWEAAGGRLDTDFSLANDFELWTRFFRHAELHTVDRHLGCFRVRPGQRSIVFRKRYETEVSAIVQRELDALEPEFRDAFRDILPEAPQVLDEGERHALNRRLAVCDPPIIRASTLRKPGSKAAARASRQPAERVFASSLERASAASDLSRFKDIHAGQRCFIMGNGPSLKQMDLSLLEDETVFACNSVFLMFRQLGWRPAYYTCVDSRVLPDRADDIDAMLKAHPGMTGFFPAQIQEHVGDKRRYPARTILPSHKNRFYFNEVFGSIENLPDSMFSADINDHVIQPHTVAITMLQIAAYMGFSQIYLIGCDTRYQVPATARHEDVEAAEADRKALVSTRDDDPNHFDPAYFGKGRKWHVPNPALMIEHYKQARRALEPRGISVFNATVGGDLEVFDRVEFNTLFDAEAVHAAHPASGRAFPLPFSGLSLPGLRTRIAERFHTPAGWLTILLLSIWRNRMFVAGVGAFALLLAAVLLTPGLEAHRALILAIGLPALALTFTLAVALKTRRLLQTLTGQITALHQREATQAFKLVDMESQMEDLRARLDGVEED